MSLLTEWAWICVWKVRLFKLQTPKINMRNDKIIEPFRVHTNTHTHTHIQSANKKSTDRPANLIGWCCVYLCEKQMWRKINKTQNDQTNRSKEIEVDIERKKEMNMGMGMNECISCLMIWIYRYTLHYAYETFIAMDVSLAQRICETWKSKNLKCFIFAGARDHTSKKLDINTHSHTHTAFAAIWRVVVCIPNHKRKKNVKKKYY